MKPVSSSLLVHPVLQARSAVRTLPVLNTVVTIFVFHGYVIPAFRGLLVKVKVWVELAALAADDAAGGGGVVCCATLPPKKASTMIVKITFEGSIMGAHGIKP